MKTYEALFIFPDSLQEEGAKAAVVRVCAEIEKQGGVIKEKRELGRRSFSRPMQKKDSGYYLSVYFDLDPLKVSALKARYALIDEVFRCQITWVDGRILAEAAAAAEAAAKAAAMKAAATVPAVAANAVPAAAVVAGTGA